MFGAILALIILPFVDLGCSIRRDPQVSSLDL